MTDLAALPDLLDTAPADLVSGAHVATATRDVAVRRAERIRAGVVNYAQTRRDIADAYAHRDWQALGYESWETYLAGEFGEELRALAGADRVERRDAVAELRQSGMSTRAIGSALGASEATVRRDLSGASFDAPEAIVGADGKSYSPVRPQPERTAEAPSPEAGSTAEPRGPLAPTWTAPIAPISPAVPPHLSDDPEEVDEQAARRSSLRFAESLAALWLVLDPDPVRWVQTRWRPDVYAQRELPRVRDVFDAAGLRALSKHLDSIADHLDRIGEPL